MAVLSKSSASYQLARFGPRAVALLIDVGRHPNFLSLRAKAEFMARPLSVAEQKANATRYALCQNEGIGASLLSESMAINLASAEVTGLDGGPDAIYVNNAQLVMTPWDIEICFGKIAGIQGDVITVNKSIRVTMSLEHAKALNKVLGEHIDKFEEQFGEVPCPGKGKT